MAVDMFMKIGDIKGESADDKHKDEIDYADFAKLELRVVTVEKAERAPRNPKGGAS